MDGSIKKYGRPAGILVAVAIIVLSIVVRIRLYPFASGDFRVFLTPWYDFIKDHGGFGALKDQFANYNVPYLYLLVLATHIPGPAIYAIKSISVAFDIALAACAYGLVNAATPVGDHETGQRVRVRPLIAAALVFAAPTVVANSSAWAQCDSIYAAFCLAGLYALMKHRPWWAWALFGAAVSFKLQAMFFLPAFGLVALARRERLIAIVAAPLAFLALLVPARIAGRGFASLISIYPDQVRAPGSGGGGTSRWMFNAPTWYQWAPASGGVHWKYAGFALAAMISLGLGAYVWRRNAVRGGVLRISDALPLAAVVVLAVVFVLPSMHDRYLYVADVLTIVAACARPRYAICAIGVQCGSLLAYLHYLRPAWVSGISMKWSALPVLIAVVVGIVLVVRDLSKADRTDPGTIAPLQPESVLTEPETARA